MATDQSHEGVGPRPNDPDRVEPTDRLAEQLELDASEALEILARAARDNPHLALAGATAVGFVLGGGLTPRLLGAVGWMAARFYLRRTIGETIESLTP